MKHKAEPWKIVYIVIALAIILWIDLGSTLPLLLHRPENVAHEEFDLNECDLYIEDDHDDTAAVSRGNGEIIKVSTNILTSLSGDDYGHDYARLYIRIKNGDSELWYTASSTTAFEMDVVKTGDYVTFDYYEEDDYLDGWFRREPDFGGRIISLNIEHDPEQISSIRVANKTAENVILKDSVSDRIDALIFPTLLYTAVAAILFTAICFVKPVPARIALFILSGILAVVMVRFPFMPTSGTVISSGHSRPCYNLDGTWDDVTEFYTISFNSFGRDYEYNYVISTPYGQYHNDRYDCGDHVDLVYNPFYPTAIVRITS